MPRFMDTKVDREGRWSLGADAETAAPFLSIPVANRMVDYEEYYRLSEDEARRFEADGLAARTFADECRARQHDDRLILAPGSDRGEPR
ncbi:hypothetical protein [Glacieibacterium frigidum]|uniref:Uncharacterized protein n=1 Tax=Glacieibacterium frigidum TaxID=2593303 RepID=A0A552UH47_9SPHN|nr:hypothetical protein [Glacieibacterium frigidum]TRW17553.1 hypothetical protein FMM06_05210 [Glacieibacterium frigidum]